MDNTLDSKGKPATFKVSAIDSSARLTCYLVKFLKTFSAPLCQQSRQIPSIVGEAKVLL